MDVLTAPGSWYPDDINSKLDFDEFKDSLNTDKVLYIGMECIESPSIVSRIKNKTKYSAYINLEHPCSLYGGVSAYSGLDPVQQQEMFNEVYTICPYTADYLNGLDIDTKFYAIPYPHNLKYDKYENPDKTYDVAYCGLIHSEEIGNYIEAVKEYSYFFSCIPQWNRVNSVNHLVTHSNLSNLVKWDHLSRSKASIIQNNLYLNPEQINKIKMLPHWERNKAFSHLDEGILPQLKSRTVEAILCKSVMLVKKDPWNVIEYWFEPDKDFVYFKDVEDLNKKVKEISENWIDYQFMVNSAYNKLKEKYNTKYIFERIKSGESIR